MTASQSPSPTPSLPRHSQVSLGKRRLSPTGLLYTHVILLSPLWRLSALPECSLCFFVVLYEQPSHRSIPSAW